MSKFNFVVRYDESLRIKYGWTKNAVRFFECALSPAEFIDQQKKLGYLTAIYSVDNYCVVRLTDYAVFSALTTAELTREVREEIAR